MNYLDMRTLVFSVLTNFYKSFDNGITLVLVLSMIPIFLLGMTGIADEAFAQNQQAPSEITPVYVGTTDLSNLSKQPRGQSQVFDTPYLTKNPQLYDDTKEHPLKMKTSKKMARIISQIPSQAPQPAAVNQITGFDGLTQNGFIPPDVQIATGPNDVVELVNVIGRIWDTQGTFEMDFTLQNLFNTTDVPFDPKIFYDTQSGRWFASATTFENDVHIAVSTTNDPKGTWNNYIISFPNNRFPDQPRIGVSDDKFIISINVFHPNAPIYYGVTLFVLDKSQMVAGVPAASQQVNLGTSRFSVKPVQSLSSTSTLYMVSLDDLPTDSTVTLWTITGSASNPTILTRDLSIDASTNPPNAKQMGTSNLSDTGDIRIQDARWFQGDLWFALNNACTPSGDTVSRSCVHLVQIDTISNPPNVTQDMQFGENGFYFFYPALSIDQFGGLGVVFGHSSESTFPSLAITGQPAGSPLNTLQPRNDIKIGSDVNPTSRYGDYFGAATSPTNPSVIWVAGQYHDSPSWSTWIGTFSVSDADVDGVEDAVDNCPTIKNGINEDNQADTDNDGIGDACDPTPNGDPKSLEIIGDPTTSGLTTYQIVVTGQITKGPNANPSDVVSGGGTTINGEVYPTGLDDYSFTGIFTLTGSQNVVTKVNGVDVPNGSPNILQIKGDPTTSGLTTYQIVVSGQITKGPNANPSDVVSGGGTTINGEVYPTGLDDYTFTGTIVSITATQHVSSLVNGVDVPNGSPPP